MIATALLEQSCNKSDNINKVVASCWQLVPNLLTTCNKPCEHNLLTACLHTCYKLWDFYVCSFDCRNIHSLKHHRLAGSCGFYRLAASCQQVAASLLNSSSTHVKISQLVASLQISRQQVVFARLVTTCQQVWNKLLTTCNNLVDIIRLVTRLFQQVCYNHDIAILLQPCVSTL